MTNKVIKPFRDTTDNGKRYKKGDSYTHKDEKRIAFLVGKGYLEKSTTTATVEAKHTGGGWYELPNGEKVKGKEAAEQALKEM